MNRFISPILIACTLLAIVVLLAVPACKKDNGGGKPKTEECITMGTLVKMGCVTSAMNDLWIRTDEGTLMRPCELLVPNPQLYYTEGMRIKFGYTPTAVNCGDISHCSSVPPPYNQIAVTCLEVIDQQQDDCNTLATIVQAKPTVDNPDCKTLLLQMSNGMLFEPVNQELLNGYSINDKILCAFKEVYTLVATCSGASAIQLSCVRPARFCGTEVCPGLTIGDDPKETGGYTISHAYIQGNFLKVKVGYSGCAPHAEKFVMVWNGSVAKSIPAQVSLTLVDTQPQMCAAYFEDEMCWDLSSLRDAVQQGAITIRINGYDQTFTLE